MIARGGRLSPDDESSDGPFWVGVASELTQPEGAPAQRMGRLVVLGSSAPFLNNTMQDPTLVGAKRLVESGVSWLVSRPQLVSLPDKVERKASLPLTEAALSQVASYVLLYLPGVALLLGLLVFLRRRRVVGTQAKKEAA